MDQIVPLLLAGNQLVLEVAQVETQVDKVAIRIRAGRTGRLMMESSLIKMVLQVDLQAAVDPQEAAAVVVAALILQQINLQRFTVKLQSFVRGCLQGIRFRRQ